MDMNSTTKSKLYQKGLNNPIQLGVRLDPAATVALAGIIEMYQHILGRKPSHTLLFRRFLQIVNDHVGEAIVHQPPEQRSAAIAAEREAVLKLVRG